MNIRLLSEIFYSPWLIDKESALGYAPLINSLITGTRVDDRDLGNERADNKSFVISTADKMVSRWSLDDANIPEGSTAIIPIRGEIMKYSQECGPRGSVDIADDIIKANSNINIASIVLVIDSPGGQVTHTDILAETIRQASTPVLAFVEGMAASAAYWIASSADRIIASGNLDKVGSIGTMLFFADFTPYYEEQGVKFHEFYATKSTDKNKDANEVLAGKYDNYRKNTLDVINEEFHSAVRSNRPGISDQVFTGKTYFAPEAIQLGLIDAIGDFQSAVSEAQALPPRKLNNQNSHNSMKMKIKATWLAIMSFFSFDAAKDNEIDEAQLESLNNELQLRADNIVAITTERDQAREELLAATTARETAESGLATANQTIEQLRTENAALKAAPGAASATVTSKTESGSADDEKEDPDVAAARTMSAAEYVQYLNNKSKSKTP